MKKKYLKLIVAASVFLGSQVDAQMSGIYTVPGSFPTLATAIASLNSVGSNGPVTLNISGGYTETAPVGGYALTATGTSVNPIVIQRSGSGANPVLTAYAGGTATPASAVQDGVFRLIGCDYVSITNIDITDANTANPATMEFGYGLFKAGSNNGCQHNLIAGCVITLNRINNASGVFPAAHGSRGIEAINALSGAHTTDLLITAAAGANSNNGFFSNTIRNCNYGVVLQGFADVTPFAFADSGNQLSGNTIFDFGGAPAAINDAAAVVTSAQQKLNVSGNTINSNTGAGIDHAANLHGIRVNLASSSASNINGNSVTLHGSSTSSLVTGIACTGTANATSYSYLSMSGNTIKNCSSAAAASGNFYGIYNAAACDTMDMNGNTFANNASAVSSGLYYNIYNSGNVRVSLNINGNQMNTGDFTAATVSSTICNIYCSGTAVTASAGISGNLFQNTNFTGATGGTGLYAPIRVTATATTLIVTGNTFNNLALNSTGPVYLIYHNSATPVVGVFGNNVATGFSRTAAAGDTYFYYGNSSALSGTTGVSYNTISSVSQTGTSGFYGIYNNSTAMQSQEFNSNTFNDISTGSGMTSIISMTAGLTTSCLNNTISDITTNGPLYGIQCSAGNTQNNIYQNSLSGFTSMGAASVCPVYVSSASRATIYRNRIYDIAGVLQGSSVFGIYLAGGTPALTAQNDTLYNNLIGNLHTPLAAGNMPLAGIYIEGGAKAHVWFNTIYLSETNSSVLFGSAAVFASVTPSVELKNNILVNTSSHTGAGITSAYRRSGSSLLTYMPGSDHNLFYAGPATTGNAVFYDGITAYSFLSDFKTAVSGRELLSVTENPAFTSTQGNAGDFLNIDPSLPTQIESGASPIAQVSDDFSATMRDVLTPDIGAWETSLTPAGDLLPPTLLNPGFINSNCSQALRTLTLSLTDVSGVAGGTLSPKLYYTVNAGAYSSSTGTLVSGTALNGVWSFNFNYATSPGDVISYYIVAQDVSALPNLMASPAVGFAGNSVNTVVTAPFSPATYTILATPFISAPNVSVCIGSNGMLAPDATNGSLFTWQGPMGYTATTQSATVSPVTAAAAGVYTVITTSANGCTASATASLSAQALPVISINPLTPTLCAGEATLLSAAGAASYSWMPGGSTSSTLNVMPASTSGYTVAGTTTAGCVGSLAISVVVTECTGIKTNAGETKALSLYPNPSTGVLNLLLNFEGQKEIGVINTLGETVIHLNSANTFETLDLSGLSKGMYVVKVTGAFAPLTSKIILD